MGHPFEAFGIRRFADLAHHLQTRPGLGLPVMCCAGGIGTGTLLEAA
ncbi:3-oxoadipyl-CoA thiolase [Amycolatopsis sulphurea]|nr:3-oxoadipyl-CoA thiolase [Amycolatopsis sulphurea]